MSIPTLRDALQTIVRECPNQYAKTYADAALNMGDCINGEVIVRDNSVEVRPTPSGKMMVGEELHTQILYILSNMAGWRGERAREVKAILKFVNKRRAPR